MVMCFYCLHANFSFGVIILLTKKLCLFMKGFSILHSVAIIYLPVQSLVASSTFGISRCTFLLYRYDI